MKRLIALMFTIIVAFLVASVTGFHPAPVAAVLIVLSVPMAYQKHQGMAMMALQKEIWEKDIIQNLFKNNAFALRSRDLSQHVLAGKVVHLPVAGAAAQVKKNLTSFPQVAVNRTDSELTFELDTLYSLPRQIQEIEKYELSYDKRQSVVGEDEQNLIQSAMDSLLYRWGPAAANVIETTGAASAADLIDTTATGTRKLFTKDEFKSIAKRLAKVNITGTITALLTAAHYHQLFESFSDAEKTNFNSFADPVNGIVGRYMGIDILMRSSVLRYRKVSTVWTLIDEQDAAFTAGTGDSAASLFYHTDSVVRAVGDVKVFEDNGNPLYYGDVFSALIRIGGRIRRPSGVWAVVEGIGA